MLAFGAGAVVADDVEDERVLAQAALFQAVHDAADLHVGVFDEAGEEFHATALEGTLVFRDVRPGGHRFIAWGELGAGRDDAHFELTFVDAFAIGVPAVVELAFVFVRPLGENVMRTVNRAGRPIHQEGFVGRVGLAVVDPRQCLVHHVLGEVVFRIVVRRLDGVVVFHEARFPLRGFTGEEAVEVVEAVSVRPAILRSHVGGLGRGRVVPLAEGGGAVTVVLQHLGHGRGFLRDHAGVAVECHRALGDGAGADAGVVSAG